MKSNVLKNNKKILSVIACLLVIGIITGIGIYTYSKYTSVEETGGEIQLEEFYVVARLYYQDSATFEEHEITITTNDDGSIQYVEITPEEFETLHVDVEYSGKAKIYCRFALECSWYHSAKDGIELVPHEYPEYTYDEEVLYNNTEKDGWIYFKEIMEPEDDTAETRVYENVLAVSDAGEDVADLNDESDKADHLRIAVSVDCVQYNRVNALWNMTSLPWE